MKLLKKWILPPLCGLLALSLWGCGGGALPSSSLPESSAPASSGPVSSVLESSDPQTESSWFTPAADLIPDASPQGTGDFEDVFSQNPIDKQYDADYGKALSFAMMMDACQTAQDRWKAMVDTALADAIAALPQEEGFALRAEQDRWEQNAEKQLDAQKEESGNEAVLSAAKEAVLLYRQRAMELFRVRFDLDGTLPQFPEETSGS